MSSVMTTAMAARQELTGFEGRLVAPEDPDYELFRSVYNAMIDKHPALIAVCAGPGDVARAIGFARDHDLALAVRGGGHNGGGLGTVDDGVVIDLSMMKDIQVDPTARTVKVAGGCVWGEVDAATGEHGLATPSGIIATTGVGGLTPALLGQLPLGVGPRRAHAYPGSPGSTIRAVSPEVGTPLTRSRPERTRSPRRPTKAQAARPDPRPMAAPSGTSSSARS